MKKTKGRPKSAATIELERMNEMLKNIPAYIKMTASEIAEVGKNLESAEVIRRQILKDYKTSPSIPDDHAYLMASLGDESLIGHEAGIISRDNQLREKAQEHREAGAESTKTGAEKRATELCKKNRMLLERLAPTGNLSLSDIAKKIIKEWAFLPPGSRMPGEPDTLMKRGIGGEPPTERTIRNYIGTYGKRPSR